MTGLAYERLHENLKTLGMDRISEVLDGQLEVAGKENISTLELLDRLIQEEVEAKFQKSLNFRSRLAKFPCKKTLEEFDFSFQPSIDKKTINGLATLKFVYALENAIFLGPPGVGKTHLAIALGLAAIKAGFMVYFTTAADLVEDLRDHAKRGLLKQRIGKLGRHKLLIVDEIGYLPMSREDANLLFQLVSRRYEKASMILTSNKPFKDWGEVFTDEVVAAAIMDRLLHHCTVVNIKGDSYRVKDRRRTGLLRSDTSDAPTR